MALLLAFLAFVIVAVLLLVVVTLAGGEKRQDLVRRRLEAIEKAQRRSGEALELQLIRDELLSDYPWLHRLLLRWSWSWRARGLLTQAGMKIRPARLILLSIGLAVGGFLLFRLIYGPVVIALTGAAVGGVIPITYVLFRRWRRLRDFEKNFPEAIDLLVRAVRAGHAFTTGLEMIGTELPEPVAGEFRTTFEEQKFGLPLKEAMLNLAERVPLIDVRFFVTAILIQKETGGNLAEILENLAYVIRERFRIYGEVRIKTAQGRLTAGILIALPLIWLAILTGLNPTYMRPLFYDPLGPWLLVIGGIMQIIGSLLLWKIVNIEV